MLRVIDPRAPHDDALADVGFGKVPAVASHELDHQIAVLLGVVGGSEKIAVRPVKRNIDMEVAVLLMAHERNRSLRSAAGIEHSKAAGVIDAIERVAR